MRREKEITSLGSSVGPADRMSGILELAPRLIGDAVLWIGFPALKTGFSLLKQISYAVMCSPVFQTLWKWVRELWRSWVVLITLLPSIPTSQPHA